MNASMGHVARLRIVALLCTLAPAVSALASDESPDFVFGPAGTLLEAGHPAAPFASLDARAGDFLPNVRVDDDVNPEHREPAVVWGPGGELCCVYAERATHYNPELVMFTRSLDGGATWLWPAVRINDTAPNATFMPAVGTMDDGTILVAWGEMKFGPNYNNEIRFSRSADGGLTWTPSVVVHPSQPTTDFLRPSLLVAGGRILVAYWAEVAYPNARPTVVWSDDGGEHWSAPVTVSTMTGPYDGSAPCIAWNEARGTVGLVMPTSGETVYFFTSADLGPTWSAGVQVNDASASSVDYPDLACHEGYDYVVWNDNRAGQYNTDVWISRSADGVVFDTDVRVSDYVAGNQYEPHIAIDTGGRIHVGYIWNLPFQGNIDLYYTVSADGGATWLGPSPRVNDVPYVVQPYVAWTSDLLADASGVAYLFWNDGRASGYYDNIYFSRNIDPAAIGDGTAHDGEGTRLFDAGFCRVAGQPGPEPVLRLRLDRPIDDLRLEWIDAQGRAAGILRDGGLPAGDHALRLVSPHGAHPLPAGVYLLRMTAGRETTAQRVVVVR